MTFCKVVNNTSRARTDGERRKALQLKALLCVFYHEAKCLLAMAFCKAVNNTSRTRTDGERRKDLLRKSLLCVL